MAQLSRIFGKEIHRIEIFDNSHLAGTFNVSGMVVFMDGEPYKQGYRLYRLARIWTACVRRSTAAISGC